MEFFKHFPLFSIIICFVGVVLCSLFDRKKARITAFAVEIISIILGIGTLLYTLKYGTTIYQMGHLTDKGDGVVYYWFNNVIRFGVLESILVIVFSTVLFLSILGGLKKIEDDVDPRKEKYFYVLSNLVLVALIALIYTDDIFTGYVFLEISTLSSIGLIMIKHNGKTTIAAIRYMIFNLVGSGLYLISCVLLYDLTGYFMFEKIMEKLSEFVANNQNLPAITITFAMMSIGLGIKSGLFPFYYWMPDAYGESTPASSSIVSGLISKGYIILLIKYIYRGFGFNHSFLINGNTVVLGVIEQTHMLDLLFILGALGMIFGSISAIKQRRINTMIAYSSAAQIGYIYLAIGFGEIGMVAAIFQLLTHCITKPLLFISGAGLVDASNRKQQFKYLTGSGKRNILAGIGFTIGAFSMIGFPLLAGFMVKYLYFEVAVTAAIPTYKVVIGIIALVISTLLNAAYFIRTVIRIYYPKQMEEDVEYKLIRNRPDFIISIVIFSIMNFILGMWPGIIEALSYGLASLGYVIL